MNKKFQKVKKEELTKYLNAIYQNTKTALQSIEDIMPKADNEALKTELAREQDAYYLLSKECELFAKSENIENIKAVAIPRYRV